MECSNTALVSTSVLAAVQVVVGGVSVQEDVAAGTVSVPIVCEECAGLQRGSLSWRAPDASRRFFLK